MIPAHLVLYDGECGFCDRSVRWLLDVDRAGALRFAPLQGETATTLRARHPEIPSAIETLVYVRGDAEGERVFLRSEAVFQLLRALPMPWRIFRVFAVLPRLLTDLGYRGVAALRYRLAGRLAACRMPSPEERSRFLP